MVGNKIDLAEKWEVSTEEANALAEELEVVFIEVSAKTGVNVKNLFKNLAQTLTGDSAAKAQAQKENVVLDGDTRKPEDEA